MSELLFGTLIVMVLMAGMVLFVLSRQEKDKPLPDALQVLIIMLALWISPLVSYSTNYQYEGVLEKPSMVFKIYKAFLPTTLGLGLSLLTAIVIIVCFFYRPKTVVEGMNDEIKRILKSRKGS